MNSSPEPSRCALKPSLARLCSLVALAAAPAVQAANYYVAPSGNDTNSGSFASPFFNIARAASLATAGDFIFVRGGTFNYTNIIRLTNSGSVSARIHLWAYTNESPFLDFSAQADDPANRAFLVTGDAWHIKGLEIYRAGDNGMKIEGSHHIIEQCAFHHCRDSGLQIGFADASPDDPTLCASNLVLNCDSYLNYDPRASGGNADGFGCKLHPGEGNAFRGCRSWENSDDGWDFYKAAYQIVVEDCWTWHNGDPASFGVSSAGNAGGFKMGGDSNYAGHHLYYRCIAFNNHYGGTSAGKAFHQNDNQAGLILYNCLSFSNNYNYALNNDIPEPHVMKNCVGFAGITKNAATNSTTLQFSNSWNLVCTPDAADYGDLSETAAKAARGADGSLPTGFARLVAGSDLIDRGTNVGFAFNGVRPDLGPFEFAAAPRFLTLSSPQLGAGGFSFQVGGLTSHGAVVVHISSNLTSWSPLLTNAPQTGTMPLLDPTATNRTTRFYRVEEL